jgi:hypothetical protein
MSIRRKHLRLEQTKLDRVRRLFGVTTDQAAIELALDLVLADESLLRTHRSVRRIGGVADVFGSTSRRPSSI